MTPATTLLILDDIALGRFRVLTWIAALPERIIAIAMEDAKLSVIPREVISFALRKNNLEVRQVRVVLNWYIGTITLENS